MLGFLLVQLGFRLHFESDGRPAGRDSPVGSRELVPSRRLQQFGGQFGQPFGVGALQFRPAKSNSFIILKTVNASLTFGYTAGEGPIIIKVTISRMDSTPAVFICSCVHK